MNKSQNTTAQRQSSVLDGRCHISYDIAMKKYHNDIGIRLSKMLIQEQYASDSDVRLSQDFCMLTIDTRNLKSLKHETNPTIVGEVNRGEDADLSLTNVTSSYSTTSEANTSLSTSKEQENCPRKKRLLFDKFTCSLFLRKHMCSRCKRKSRSCVSNKTFSGTEKRYICCRCRKSSQSTKNIFDLQSKSKNCANLNSTTVQSIVSPIKDRAHIPRKNIKDSGYDTVTSCSTVASAYSAFSTPANMRQNINKDGVPVKTVLFGDQGRNSELRASIYKFNNYSAKNEPAVHIPCVYSDSDLTAEDVADIELKFSNFPPAGQQESSEDELTQTKQRNTRKYDGYLPELDHNTWGKKNSRPAIPEMNHNTWGQNISRPALSDTSNIDDTSENGDYCYFPPRIIRVSQSEKISNSSQKSCYTCDSTSKPCFRLPWEGGWICEDCLDGLH
uniref:Uncharacterized protein n=2 Tax=Arion vulgaris TaxID=1028688 RepID=A0A0B7BII0_9EUPU